MNIERAAEEHIMGQGKVDEIKITIANNGYIIEYEWYFEKDNITECREIKKVFLDLIIFKPEEIIFSLILSSKPFFTASGLIIHKVVSMLCS